MQTMKKDRIYRKMPGSAGTAFRKYGRPLFVFAAAILAAGCFRDLGNYDYTEINEAVIGDSGFSSPYNIRINETLSIRPDITFTLDPDGTGDYTYEWVAVGQTLYRGERFTIGTGRDLDYVMKLNADNYILYLKVMDNATGIVYSKDVELNVMSPYSTGWMMAGEAGGKGQVDMMSISGDVIFYTGAVTMEDGISLGPIECIWVDNDTYTSDDRVYIGTASGSYKLDRSSFSGSAAGDIKYSFAIDPGEDTYSLTDSEQVRTDTAPLRHSVIINGRAYIVSTEGGMIENSFSFYEDADGNQRDIHVADRIICNHSQSGCRTMVFYNTDDREFCYISGLSVEGMKTLGDGEDDLFSWKTGNDFPETGGLDFVSCCNSFFSNGQSAAILKVPDTDTYYIYCITANRNQPDMIKNGRYAVDNGTAPGFGDSPSYAMTTNHGYMLYASGNTLYGYNFRKEPQECTVLHTFDAPVCFIMADNETEEKYDDCIYVATYDDSRERSGILYKFRMTDSPDRMELTLTETWDEGLLKIHDMYYKTF